MKRVGTILFIMLWWGVFLLPTGGVLAQGEGHALIQNGDFSQGLEGWAIEQSPNCTSCMIDVVSGKPEYQNVLVWERTNSRADGGALGARQTVNVDVREYDQLLLNLVVWVDSHSLPNSGWWSDEHGGSGEYPVKISLRFTDAGGATFEWAYGFLVTHDGSTALSNYMLVPAMEWTPLETDVFSPYQWVDGRGNPLPEPVKLTDVWIGGAGWDFAGAVASIQLVGTFPGGAETGEETGEGTGGETVAGFIVEEYPLVSAAEDTPDHFEFRDRVSDVILNIRRAWREPDPADRVAATNAIISAFGYRLVPAPTQTAMYPIYELYFNDTLMISDVTHVWPIAANSTGDRFMLLLDSMTQPTLVVVPDTIGQLDTTTFVYIAPVYVGDDLYEVQMSADYSQFYVTRNGEVVYTVTPTGPWVEPPVKALWSWNGHWVLEVDGEVLVDGQSLNQQLGYDEIFAWQLIAGQPFYFFKVGDQIGMSYAGEVLPYQYDDVVHYLCCEPSMFNVSGNGTMVWFYALRDGIWYYVEAGVYGE